MITLTPGYKYELENFENKEAPGQTLQFIEKVPGGPGQDAPKTINDGTTNEELLAVLIDRLYFLKKKLPSRETSCAITKAEEALLWLNKRTADRKDRGVEGTLQA